jgi:AraC family transcriptional regulator, transcriptional activator of pobA
MQRSITEELDSEVSIQHWENMSPVKVNQYAQLRKNKRIGFIFLKNGNGQLCIDGYQYPMKNDTLYCVPAGRWYMLNLSGEVGGFMILFPDALLQVGYDNSSMHCRSSLFDRFDRQPALRIDQDGVIEMVDIATRMMELKVEALLFQTEMLKAYGGIFLVQLARQMDSLPKIDTQTKDIQLVEKFMALVKTRYLVWRRVTDYAAEIGITPNYLNGIVKRVSGDTVSGHIRRRIVLEAKRKAVHDHSSMKEISFCLGFKDVAHFSKFFKSVYGKNFTDFQREA